MVLTSMVTKNKSLWNCENITQDYSIEEILVPPLGHTQRNTWISGYNMLTRIEVTIRNHIAQNHADL